MHEHVDAIKSIARRVVGREIAIARDLGVAVKIPEFLVVDDQAYNGSDYLAAILDTELSFGEARDLRSELITAPGAAGLTVNVIHNLADRRVVRKPRVAKAQMMRQARLGALGPGIGASLLRFFGALCGARCRLVLESHERPPLPLRSIFFVVS